MALIDGLISYYKLDEAAGAVLDSHGTNPGTNNGATPNVAGKINTAYDFERSEEDFVDCGDFDILGNISVSCWIKLESIGIEQWIIAKDDETDGRAWGFAVGTANKLQASIGGSTKLPANTALSAGTWYHVGFTFNDATNEVIYYLNGSADGTIATIQTIPGTATSVTIGKRNYANFEGWFDGIIDELGVWDKVLTAEEIGTGAGTLYNNGNGLAYPFVVGTNMKINIGDVFKDIESLKINIGNAWKNVIKVQQNIGGVWKNVFG